MESKNKKIIVGIIISLVIVALIALGVSAYTPIYQAEKDAYNQQQLYYQLMHSDDYTNVLDWERDVAVGKEDLVEYIEDIKSQYETVITEEQTNSLDDILKKLEDSKTIADINELKIQCEDVASQAEEALAEKIAEEEAIAAMNAYNYYNNYNYQSNDTYVDQSNNDCSTQDGGVLTQSGGVNYYNGRTETWYSSNVLYHYRTSEWTPDANGVYRDAEGYVIVAASDLAQGTVIDTSHGEGKVYDSGCAAGVTDIYVNW